MYRAGGITDFVYAPHVLSKAALNSREHGRLAYWGLIEEMGDVRREDGGRAGWWRVTRKGRDFIYGRIFVPWTALTYGGKTGSLLGFEGKPVSVHDCLKDKFDYRELMGSSYEEPGPTSPEFPTLWGE
jgi:hypothetical protein